jgi:DUF2948 family protein
MHPNCGKGGARGTSIGPARKTPWCVSAKWPFCQSKQFAMVAARFDWVRAAAKKGGRRCCERCRTGLHFGRVLKVSCLGFHCRDKALVLNLLDIGFKETEPPAGFVEFIFSAGRALRLEVECVEAEIRDLGFRWHAKSAPHHPFDGADKA